MKKTPPSQAKTVFSFQDKAFARLSQESLQNTWPNLSKRAFVGEASPGQQADLPDLIQLSLAYLLCRCGYIRFSLEPEGQRSSVLLEVAG